MKQLCASLIAVFFLLPLSAAPNCELKRRVSPQ
jgi:hypothetical protein